MKKAGYHIRGRGSSKEPRRGAIAVATGSLPSCAQDRRRLGAGQDPEGQARPSAAVCAAPRPCTHPTHCVLLSLILLLPWGLEQVPKVSRGPSQFALGGKRGWGVTPKQGSGQGEGVLCLLGIGPFSDTPTRMGSQPSGAARSPPPAPADPHAHTEESGERLGMWAAGSHSGQGVGTGVYKAPVCCGCPARSQKHPRSSVSSTPFHCSGSCWVKHLHPLSSLQEPSLLFIRQGSPRGGGLSMGRNLT